MGKWEHKGNEDKTSSRRVLIEYFSGRQRIRLSCKVWVFNANFDLS